MFIIPRKIVAFDIPANGFLYWGPGRKGRNLASKEETRMLPRRFALTAIFGLTGLCASTLAPAAPAAVLPVHEKTLMLATTTSVDATGLLDVLADAFEKESGIALKWVAVGTGAALKLARDGNADVVIAHARKLEDEFLAAGYGVNRRVIARNHFLIVGPAADPAGAAGSPDAQTAFERIKAAGAVFVSRGDNSGTHVRELDLWALAGGSPKVNYLETGQGMAQTLLIAAERSGYTLTDSASFAALAAKTGLRILLDRSADLENIYSVIAVDPARIAAAKYDEAMAFVAFLTSPRGQALIGSFRGKTERQLFEPLAGKPGIDLIK
jgi:tungstate transport system substrate-binding protein